MKQFICTSLIFTIIFSFISCSKETTMEFAKKDILADLISEEIVEITGNLIDDSKDIVDEYRPIETKEIEKAIDKFLEEYENEKIGIVYVDLKNGDEININGDKLFFGASTYKVLMNIVAYEYVKNGQVSLDDIVYYKDEDYEEGGSYVVSSGGYRLGDLLDYSITYSDNISSNMIWRYLGGYTSVMNKASEILDVEISGVGNDKTPDSLAKALKFIYDNRDDKYYSHLIEVMKTTIFHDRLDKYIPNDIVAHKVGMYGSYIHDVGIIFTDNPYILCVFTERLDNGYEMIAEISEIIYNFKK